MDLNKVSLVTPAKTESVHHVASTNRPNNLALKYMTSKSTVKNETGPNSELK